MTHAFIRPPSRSTLLNLTRPYDLIVSCEPPAELGENQIVIASPDELRAARLSKTRGQRTAGTGTRPGVQATPLIRRTGSI
jgi:hypothetical protein